MSAVMVNGVGVDATAFPSPEAAAGHELLRQRAVEIGLAADGATGMAIDEAIEQLLEREVAARAPDEEECRRYYEAHPKEFTSGELVFARHILFQVTPRVPVPAIRARAELMLAELGRDSSRFEARARANSRTAPPVSTVAISVSSVGGIPCRSSSARSSTVRTAASIRSS